MGSKRERYIYFVNAYGLNEEPCESILSDLKAVVFRLNLSEPTSGFKCVINGKNMYFCIHLQSFN